MEELEDMKTMWVELNKRLTSLEEENRRLAKKVVTDKYKNIQEKLTRKYKIFIGIALVMIIYSFCFIYVNPMINEKYRLLTTIYWMVFFAIEAGIDSYLLFKVGEIDIYGSNIRENTVIAKNNWKFHKIGVAVGLPLAFGAIVLLALSMDADPFLILGMLFGGIVGFVIGFRQLLKFRDYYRLLQTQDD